MLQDATGILFNARTIRWPKKDRKCQHKASTERTRLFLPVIVLKTSRTAGRSVGLPGKIGNAHTKPPAMVGVFFAAIVAVTRTDGLLFLFSELRNMQGCVLALNRIIAFFDELMTFCNMQKRRKKMRLFCEKLKKSWEVIVLC